MIHNREQHEKCIEILDLLERIQLQLYSEYESRKGILGEFTNLVKKSKHRSEILMMCQIRVKERYMRAIEKLMS